MPRPKRVENLILPPQASPSITVLAEGLYHGGVGQVLEIVSEDEISVSVKSEEGAVFQISKASEGRLWSRVA